jgi:hypothetical protein
MKGRNGGGEDLSSCCVRPELTLEDSLKRLVKQRAVDAYFANIPLVLDLVKCVVYVHCKRFSGLLRLAFVAVRAMLQRLLVYPVVLVWILVCRYTVYILAVASLAFFYSFVEIVYCWLLVAWRRSRMISIVVTHAATIHLDLVLIERNVGWVCNTDVCRVLFWPATPWVRPRISTYRILWRVFWGHSSAHR